MLRKPLMLAAAGALIMVQGAAGAQTECGGIWAARCNLPKGGKAKPADKKAKDPTPAADAAPAANANANSAVAADANAAVVAGAGALGASSIAGIAAGQAVKGSDGSVLGKVSQVMKGPDGSISKVIVTSSTGRSFPVAAGKLSVSGGAVIVTDSSGQ
ncbi:hypothetical protein [Sphingomonas sp. URHD0057]|uniref:hypothetical protein n=1 Tax=Sphingomonas sp. URHD0057 TaxID=1380389 RepID=UPI0005611887|nr:hypothetical protein [Sphingomonas sp. URHD0057]